jgi:magnesium transporter
MINYYYRSIKDETITKNSEYKKGSWIFSYDISPEDIEKLVKIGFDELLLEDATDYFEVPRFEYEDGINYFFTRYVIDSKDGELSTAPILIAISDTSILTVSHRKPEFLDNFAHSRSEMITTQRVKSFLIMVETMVHQYNRSLMKIRRTMLRYFSDVGNISEKDMKHFVGLESTVADYISALSPTESALAFMISRQKKLELHEDDIDIVEDLKQDIHQLIEGAQSVSKTIQNIRSAHSSILSRKLNVTMKTLTIVTIVLMIPTIITGLFGMNTWLPFGNGPLGFIIILVLIIGMSLGVIYWFKKNDWM